MPPLWLIYRYDWCHHSRQWIGLYSCTGSYTGMHVSWYQLLIPIGKNLPSDKAICFEAHLREFSKIWGLGLKRLGLSNTLGVHRLNQAYQLSFEDALWGCLDISLFRTQSKYRPSTRLNVDLWGDCIWLGCVQHHSCTSNDWSLKVSLLLNLSKIQTRPSGCRKMSWI